MTERRADDLAALWSRRPRLRRCAAWLSPGRGSSGSVTIPWDAKAHFYAQLLFLAHALHSGESPFWAPERLRRSGADRRSAIADLHAALSAARRARSRAELPGRRRDRLRHAVCRRQRDRFSISAIAAGTRPARSSPRSPSPSAVRRPGASSISAKCCRCAGSRSLCGCSPRALERRSHRLRAARRARRRMHGHRPRSDRLSLHAGACRSMWLWQLLAEPGRLARIARSARRARRGLAVGRSSSAPCRSRSPSRSPPNRTARRSISPAPRAARCIRPPSSPRSPPISTAPGGRWRIIGGRRARSIWGAERFRPRPQHGRHLFRRVAAARPRRRTGARPIVSRAARLVFVVAALVMLLYALGSFTPFFAAGLRLSGRRSLSPPGRRHFSARRLAALSSAAIVSTPSSPIASPWPRYAIVVVGRDPRRPCSRRLLGVAIRVDHLHQALPPLAAALVFYSSPPAIFALGRRWAVRRPALVVAMIGVAMARRSRHQQRPEQIDGFAAADL